MVNGQYLDRYDTQLTTTSPLLEVVDTVYEPISFTMRNIASWSRENLNVAVFVNYADSYADNREIPAVEIDSWTTFDLNISYSTGDYSDRRWFDRTKISLNVINLFDSDPPYVRNDAFAVNFDGANADPLGRYIAVQLVKAW